MTDIWLDEDSDSDAVKVTGELMQSNRDNIASVTFWNVQSPVRDVIQCLPQCTLLSSFSVLVTNEEDNAKLVMALPHLTRLDTIHYIGSTDITVPTCSAAVRAILQLKQLKQITLWTVVLCDDTLVLTCDMTRLARLELCWVKMSAVSWVRFLIDLLSIEHPVHVALRYTNIGRDTRRMIHTSVRLRVDESNDNFVIFTTVFQQTLTR